MARMGGIVGYERDGMHGHRAWHAWVSPWAFERSCYSRLAGNHPETNTTVTRSPKCHSDMQVVFSLAALLLVFLRPADSLPTLFALVVHCALSLWSATSLLHSRRTVAFSLRLLHFSLLSWLC